MYSFPAAEPSPQATVNGAASLQSGRSSTGSGGSSGRAAESLVCSESPHVSTPFSTRSSHVTAISVHQQHADF